MLVVARVSIIAIALGLLPGALAAQTNYYGYDDFGFPVSNVTVSRSFSFPNAGAARTLFLAALTNDVGTEDFEGMAHNAAPPINLLFPGAGTAIVTGTGTVARHWSVVDEWQGNDRYPTSGDVFLDVVSNGGFTVTFGSAVAAFGFYGIDAGDVGGQLWVDFINGSGTTSVMVPHPVTANQNETGNVLFFGRIDAANPFTSVQFRMTGNAADNFSFDDMTIASVEQVTTTPEPGSLVLLGTGLAGLIAIRRRRGVTGAA